MATENFTTAPDFGDRRVFFKLDAAEVRQRAAYGGPGNLFYEQSASGPTRMYLNRDVSDETLAQMADRHGLDFDELRAFRDVAVEGATIEATRADALQ